MNVMQNTHLGYFRLILSFANVFCGEAGETGSTWRLDKTFRGESDYEERKGGGYIYIYIKRERESERERERERGREREKERERDREKEREEGRQAGMQAK
jgi:hypothetical protein